jgi:hypothetical protein
MAKDPAARYPHAGQLGDALRGARAAAFPASVSPAPSVATGPRPLPETVVTARPPAAVPPRTQAAVALDPERTRVAAQPPTLRGNAPTVHAPSASEASWPAVTPEATAGAGPQRRLVMAGAGTAVAVAIALAAWQLWPEGGSNPPETLMPSPGPAASPDAPPVVTQAPGPSALQRGRRLLEERDYRGALAEAEAGLAVSSADGELQRLRAEAEAAVRRGDAAARAVREALDARNGPVAAAALARLLDADPRSPQVPALTQGVKQILGSVGAGPAGTMRPAPAIAAGPAVTAPPVTAPPVTAPPVTVPPITLRPPPTTAGAPAPSAAEMEAGNRQAIRGVLNEYREAFEALNVDALRTIHPSVDYAAMKSAFSSVTGYTVKVQIRDIRLQGTEAAMADCLVTYSPIPKPSGKPKPVPTIFHLKKVGTVWRIDRVQRN